MFHTIFRTIGILTAQKTFEKFFETVFFNFASFLIIINASVFIFQIYVYQWLLYSVLAI